MYTAKIKQLLYSFLPTNENVEVIKVNGASLKSLGTGTHFLWVVLESPSTP